MKKKANRKKKISRKKVAKKIIKIDKIYLYRRRKTKQQLYDESIKRLTKKAVVTNRKTGARYFSKYKLHRIFNKLYNISPKQRKRWARGKVYKQEKRKFKKAIKDLELLSYKSDKMYLPFPLIPLKTKKIKKNDAIFLKLGLELNYTDNRNPQEIFTIPNYSISEPFNFSSITFQSFTKYVNDLLESLQQSNNKLLYYRINYYTLQKTII